MEKLLLELKLVSKSYIRAKPSIFAKREYVKVLKDVSLTLSKGEILGIVGDSGSGKTTLAYIIARLLKEDGGSILYKGHDISGKKETQNGIQMVFQNSYASLNPAKKISWLLKEPLDINTNLTPLQKKEKVEAVLEMTRLNPALLLRKPSQLSGGERQRVSIALALLMEPEIIILDEAVSALDASISAQILNLLMELRQKLGLSYIFITHDLNAAYFLSDNIIVMRGGEIVERGSAEDVLYNPKNDDVKALYSLSE